MTFYEVYIDSFDVDPSDIEGYDDESVYDYYKEKIAPMSQLNDIISANSFQDAVDKMDSALVEHNGKDCWIAYVLETHLDDYWNDAGKYETSAYRIVWKCDM